MPITVRCPHCLKLLGRRLPDISQWSSVDYYRCEHCAHVWTLDKRHVPPESRPTPPGGMKA